MNDQQTKVLVVFANPIETTPLRLGAEDRMIRTALSHHEKIKIDVRHAAEIHDIRLALLQDDYRVIHLSGHSDASGFMLEDRDGHAQKVEFETLAAFLAAHSPPLECVILNACSTLDQGKFIVFDVPFIIAMRAPIADRLALEFSRGFYDAMAAGKGIEFAFEEGRRCVQLVSKSQADLPVLMKHTVLDQYEKQPDGIRRKEYDRWYSELRLGKLEVRLNPSATNEVNILLSIVDRVLQETGFGQEVLDRVAVIVQELIANVRRHVPFSPANIGLEINTTHFPIVIISVADEGGGFDLKETIEQQYLKMKSGEPEHGLGRVRRFSDEIDQHFPSYTTPFHTVFSTVYVLPPLTSVFDQFPWCSRILLLEQGPYGAYFGQRHHSTSSYNEAMQIGIQQQIPQVFDAYVGHLLLTSPQYLGFELRGNREITRVGPSPIMIMVDLMKAYFPEFLTKKRIILLANQSTGFYSRQLKAFGEENGLQFFLSVDACHKALTKLNRGIKSTRTL